jgi:hypothetical protein
MFSSSRFPPLRVSFDLESDFAAMLKDLRCGLNSLEEEVKEEKKGGVSAWVKW